MTDQEQWRDLAMAMQKAIPDGTKSLVVLFAALEIAGFCIADGADGDRAALKAMQTMASRALEKMSESKALVLRDGAAVADDAARLLGMLAARRGVEDA